MVRASFFELHLAETPHLNYTYHTISLRLRGRSVEGAMCPDIDQQQRTHQALASIRTSTKIEVVGWGLRDFTLPQA